MRTLERLSVGAAYLTITLTLCACAVLAMAAHIGLIRWP